MVIAVREARLFLLPVICAAACESASPETERSADMQVSRVEAADAFSAPDHATVAVDDIRDDADHGFSARDSAGIVIAITAGTSARASLAWHVDSVHSLEIGLPDDPMDRYQFFQIRGISARGDHIVVVDGGSRELRLYDRAGLFVSAHGGQGNGPGEFQMPLLVQSFWADSILVYDGRLRRMRLYSSDGRESRDVRAELRQGGPLGVVENHVLTFTGSLLVGETPGHHYLPGSFAWSDLTASGRDTIRFPEYQRAFRHGDGRVYVGMDIPFVTRPSACVGPAGFFITDGVNPEIHQYDTAGHLHRIIRIDEPERRVTRDEFLVAASAYAGESEALRGGYEVMPLPTTRPAFQGMLVDELGWLWVELYHLVAEPYRKWMVFDTTGRALGTVDLPPELEVHHIARTFVLGRWRTEDRVEYVRKHSLTRQPTFEQ